MRTEILLSARDIVKFLRAVLNEFPQWFFEVSVTNRRLESQLEAEKKFYCGKTVGYIQCGQCQGLSSFTVQSSSKICLEYHIVKITLPLQLKVFNKFGIMVVLIS